MATKGIQYCSDLHLEFRDNSAYIKANPIAPKADILILAGDIMPLQFTKPFDWFFDRIADQFKQVYWIPGNHEYYGSDILLKSGPFIEEIRSNIFLVNNYQLDLPDVNLIFTTLWSKISPLNSFDIERGMSDYHHIKFGDRNFRTEDCNTLFEENMNFLRTAVTKVDQGKKKIVISHHVPTYKNYPEKFKYSILNEAFATELSPFIEASNVDFWIYGHSHANVPDFKIGKTTLTNNQLGYVKYRENLDYKTSACLIL